MAGQTEKLLNVQIDKGNQDEPKASGTGQLLIADPVREARRKEMEFSDDMKV